MLDGPYADTKEQFAGYFFVTVPDLDEAIAWAKRCPSSKYGSIEIRPIVEAAGQLEVSHADEAGRAAERVARESYGRLVAFLAARTRDVAGAEDALGEAFAAALRTWPRRRRAGQSRCLAADRGPPPPDRCRPPPPDPRRRGGAPDAHRRRARSRRGRARGASPTGASR